MSAERKNTISTVERSDKFPPPSDSSVTLRNVLSPHFSVVERVSFLISFLTELGASESSGLPGHYAR